MKSQFSEEYGQSGGWKFIKYLAVTSEPSVLYPMIFSRQNVPDPSVRRSFKRFSRHYTPHPSQLTCYFPSKCQRGIVKYSGQEREKLQAELNKIKSNPLRSEPIRSRNL